MGRDLLYLSDYMNDAIYRLANASTVQGAQTPAAHGGPDLVGPKMVQVVDDTLYTTDGTHLRVFANAHSLGATATATYSVETPSASFFVIH